MNIYTFRKNDANVMFVFYKSSNVEGYTIDVFLNRKNETYDNDSINRSLIAYNNIPVVSDVVIFAGILSLSEMVMRKDSCECRLYKLDSHEVINIRNKMIEDYLIKGRVIIPDLLMTHVINFTTNI